MKCHKLPYYYNKHDTLKYLTRIFIPKGIKRRKKITYVVLQTCACGQQPTQFVAYIS